MPFKFGAPIIALLIVAAVVVGTLIGFVARRRNSGAQSPVAPEPRPLPDAVGLRLRNNLQERKDLLVYVGIPPEAPTQWAQAVDYNEDGITLQGEIFVHYHDIRAFVLAYPNHQVVDSELISNLKFPPGLRFLRPVVARAQDLLQLDDLAAGRAFVAIQYGSSLQRPASKSHYSTSLKNVSRHKIRVLRFGGYTKTENGWKLSNVSGSFYSANEFRNWYNVAKDGWIGPGETVSDANNYGSRPVVWAYYCESDDGTQFVAGELLE